MYRENKGDTAWPTGLGTKWQTKELVKGQTNWDANKPPRDQHTDQLRDQHTNGPTDRDKPRDQMIKWPSSHMSNWTQGTEKWTNYVKYWPIKGWLTESKPTNVTTKGWTVSPKHWPTKEQTTDQQRVQQTNQVAYEPLTTLGTHTVHLLGMIERPTNQLTNQELTDRESNRLLPKDRLTNPKDQWTDHGINKPMHWQDGPNNQSTKRLTNWRKGVMQELNDKGIK